MARSMAESNGGREPEAGSVEPDFKWAVEWLVRKQGQRGAAEILGVNRKTVALALRRERLTGRMNHAVQTLLANLDDPAKQDVMPLDRIESQVKHLLESMEELGGQLETLVMRVETVEREQQELQAEVRASADAGEVTCGDDAAEVQAPKDEPVESTGPEVERAGKRFGWWRS